MQYIYPPRQEPEKKSREFPPPEGGKGSMFTLLARSRAVTVSVSVRPLVGHTPPVPKSGGRQRGQRRLWTQGVHIPPVGGAS